MYGFYALDSEGAQIERNVAVNVSDVFVARYVQAMEHDFLLARSRETGRAVYNLRVMPKAEWEESRVYRDAYSTHKMRHVVEVPISAGDQIVGALHCAARDPHRNFTDEDLCLAEAVAGVLAIAIAAIRSRQQREEALEEALAALELTATAVVVSDPLTADLTPNAAARRLMDDVVVEGEDHLYRLLARRPGDGRVSRRTEGVAPWWRAGMAPRPLPAAAKRSFGDGARAAARPARAGSSPASCIDSARERGCRARRRGHGRS